MAYDRGYGRERQRWRHRGPEPDYGWGVPTRGLYDHSLDYGGLPESRDSESIPGYRTPGGDATGPRARYERQHWAAAEPAGESRYRDSGRTGGRYDREFRSFRSALEAARARAREDVGREPGYGGEYRSGRESSFGRFWGRPSWSGARSGASFGPEREFGGASGRSGGERGESGAPGGRGRSGEPRRQGREWPAWRSSGGQGGGGRRGRYGWEYGAGERQRGPYGQEFGRGERGAWGEYGRPAREQRAYGRAGPDQRSYARDFGDRPSFAGPPDGYPGYLFRDGSATAGHGAGSGEDERSAPGRMRPFHGSRGPRGRWGRHGGGVAPGGD